MKDKKGIHTHMYTHTYTQTHTHTHTYTRMTHREKENTHGVQTHGIPILIKYIHTTRDTDATHTPYMRACATVRRTQAYDTRPHTHTHTHTRILTTCIRSKKKKTDFQETTVSCIIIYIPRIMSANLNGAMWNDISDDIYKY